MKVAEKTCWLKRQGFSRSKHESMEIKYNQRGLKRSLNIRGIHNKQTLV